MCQKAAERQILQQAAVLAPLAGPLARLWAKTAQ
jgi:hypothetical protein